MNIKFYNLVIIGAGVSGTFSALNISNLYKVCLIDKNKEILKKFMITGKGKSNISNNSKIDIFLNNLIGSNKFLYPSLMNYSGNDTLIFLNKNHIRYYEKEPHRFHLLDTNEFFRQKIFNLLKQKNNLDLLLNSNVNNIIKNDDHFIVYFNNQEQIKTKYLIIATGGMSFKNTGCDGFGYKIAKQFNHNIKPLFPIGVGLYIENNDLKHLQGISIDNVCVKVYNQKQKLIYSETGALMFTHYGLGGPVIRRISGYVSYELLSYDEVSIYVDYINYNSIINELNNHQYLNQCFKHYNKKMINILLNKFNQNLDLKNINKKVKENIINALYNVKYIIKKTDSINVAINTGGGIDLKQINPNTFESKLVKNLFFIGETIDINPRTNGYNITCCFSMAKKCIDYINNLFQKKIKYY